MSVTIKLRKGLASEWTSNSSIVLASGEPGLEIDTGRLKIGNGTTQWGSLQYASIIPTGFLAGSGIDIDLGTNGSTATISVSGLNSSYISDFNEAVDDRIGSGLFVAGTGINLNYNDGGNSFTVSVSGLVNNPTNNRILTSDGTSTGINAESNLTFSDKNLTVGSTGSFGALPQINIYSVTNESASLNFKNSSGSDQLQIIYDEEDDESVIKSSELTTGPLRIQAFAPITIDSQTSNVLITTPVGSGLYVNNVLVSVSGHTHTASQITDFSSSVSGLLPTIANSGDNRLLTSDGTSTGINAESNLTFAGSLLSVTGNVLIEKTNATTLEILNQSITGPSPGSNLQLTVHADNPPISGETPVGQSTPRISARKTRGTLDLPSILNDNEPLLSIRVQNINESGTYHISSRISSWSDGVVVGSGNQPTRLEFSTSPGSGAILSNTLALYSDGELNHNGYMIIEDGLSAPTPIYNLGAVSGNVSISYDFDKQIQTLSLNGTNTSFIEGSGWPSTTSVDVLLEITVSSATSVTWTMVDDFYNPVPASLSAGKYLVLLRSIGATIQGHYIGEKTN
jgi:hypothetical protein